MPCCAFGLRMEKQSSVVGRTHHRLNIGVSYNKSRITASPRAHPRSCWQKLTLILASSPGAPKLSQENQPSGGGRATSVLDHRRILARIERLFTRASGQVRDRRRQGAGLEQLASRNDTDGKQQEAKRSFRHGGTLTRDEGGRDKPSRDETPFYP